VLGNVELVLRRRVRGRGGEGLVAAPTLRPFFKPPYKLPTSSRTSSRCNRFGGARGSRVPAFSSCAATRGCVDVDVDVVDDDDDDDDERRTENPARALFASAEVGVLLAGDEVSSGFRPAESSKRAGQGVRGRRCVEVRRLAAVAGPGGLNGPHGGITGAASSAAWVRAWVLSRPLPRLSKRPITKLSPSSMIQE
jgi:hypothetical protein